MANKNALIQHSMFDVPEIKHQIDRPKRAYAQWDREKVATILHLGAGVQSSTLAEMIVEGDLEPVTAAVFCDTGNEPPWVYVQVRRLQERLASVNIPLMVLTNGSIVEDAYATTAEKRFASMPLYVLKPDGSKGVLRRQCTREYKIEPGEGWIKNWLADNGHATRYTNKLGHKGVRVSTRAQVESWFGFSLDEYQRMSAPRVKWIKKRYPLIEKRMTRKDCFRYLESKGLPIPGKSSCMVCPYHSDEFWALLKNEHPDLFEEVCKFDDWLRTDEAMAGFTRALEGGAYVHKSCQPLRSIDFDALEEQRAEMQPGQLIPLYMYDTCNDYCHT